VTFIEKLNADSLSIRAEDFERYMSGAAVPHDPAHIVTTCEGLRLMRENLTALSELRARQERLMAEALQLQQDMVDFCGGVRDQVETILKRTPLDLRPRRAAANLDDEPSPGDADRLPPPLQPQILVPMTGSTMSRSLSDLFNNGTKTISCTNAATVLPPGADASSEAHGVEEPAKADSGGVNGPENSREDRSELGSAVNPSAADAAQTADLAAQCQELDGEFDGKIDTFQNAKDGVTATGASDDPDESVLSRADDTASISSLLMDGPMMSLNDAEMSLLDDPFIALGASGDRDSLNEDAETGGSEVGTVPAEVDELATIVPAPELSAENTVDGVNEIQIA
jgi:hypothetical protein